MKVNREYSDPIKIRAHHILCIQGFQGYGYSKDFETHMQRIIIFLDTHPTTKIQIITKTDEICSYCPYNYKNSCNMDKYSPIIMEKLDKLIIKKFLLKENEIYPIEDILKLVNDNINHNTLIEICGNCSWNNKCLFFKNKI
ncbi:MAG: DUF1284 domain-containing protein [Methanobacterium sp.]|nr:DUF1284 domain-containing protein [Methanobacterium sp.]